MPKTEDPAARGAPSNADVPRDAKLDETAPFPTMPVALAVIGALILVLLLFFA